MTVRGSVGKDRYGDGVPSYPNKSGNLQKKPDKLQKMVEMVSASV